MTDGTNGEDIKKLFDELISELERSNEQISGEAYSLIEDIASKIRLIKDSKRKELLTELKKKDSDKYDRLLNAIQNIKFEPKIEVPAPKIQVNPPKVDIKVPDINVNPPEIPEIKIPEVKVPPVDLTNLEKLLAGYLEKISNAIKLPTKAKDAISVRLSDGEEHYRARGGSTTIGATGGVQDIEVEPTFNQAAITIGTSAVQLTSSNLPATRGVLVKAANSNTGLIYVGKSSAVTAGTVDATDGFELGAGESLRVRVDNANKIYIVASGASQKVFYFIL